MQIIFIIVLIFSLCLWKKIPLFPEDPETSETIRYNQTKQLEDIIKEENERLKLYDEKINRMRDIGFVFGLVLFILILILFIKYGNN